MKPEPRSWGRWPRARHELRALRWRHEPLPLAPEDSPALPAGNGRSYGDVALNDGGILLDARGLDRFIAFDPHRGIVRAEAGVLLAELLELVLPAGWFLPVTPGTRFVTLGGAVANDIHGKNHHHAGSFGHHVTALELLRSDGSRFRLSPDERPKLFRATVGGLGLTGLITWVELALRPLGPAPSAPSAPSAASEARPADSRPELRIETETLPFEGLGAFFDLSRDSDEAWEHTVAWLDLSPGAQERARGLFMRGNHASREEGTGDPSSRSAPGGPRGGEPGAGMADRELLRAAGLLPPRLSVPFVPPVSLVNGVTVALFNRAYRLREGRRRGRRKVPLGPFFHPLDGVRHWNRVYGPGGFVQWQCVLPEGEAREGLAAILRGLRLGGAASFLSVLKVFGEREGVGVLSFARPGVTLAVDLVHRGIETLALLDALDRIVVEAGGAIYPAKDARMAPATFRASFPGWEAMGPHLDPALSSSFWRRVTGSDSAANTGAHERAGAHSGRER